MNKAAELSDPLNVDLPVIVKWEILRWSDVAVDPDGGRKAKDNFGAVSARVDEYWKEFGNEKLRSEFEATLSRLVRASQAVGDEASAKSEDVYAIVDVVLKEKSGPGASRKYQATLERWSSPTKTGRWEVTSFVDVLNDPVGARAALMSSGASPVLELRSWRWRESVGYAIVEGDVANMSSESLDRIEAVVTWRARDNEVVASESALVEQQPIPAGQSSPFRVLTKWNPAMHSASINFRVFYGTNVKWRRKDDRGAMTKPPEQQAP